jgi:predicted ATPase
MAPSAHETLATINSRLLTPIAIERAKSGLAGWATAEILRALGEYYLENDPGRHLEPEHLFKQALAIARSQGARAFELRAATSLARSLRARHCLTEAEDVLSAPFSRFTQGLDTRDLRTARGVLEEIQLDRKR